MSEYYYGYITIHTSIAGVPLWPIEDMRFRVCLETGNVSLESPVVDDSWNPFSSKPTHRCGVAGESEWNPLPRCAESEPLYQRIRDRHGHAIDAAEAAWRAGV